MINSVQRKVKLFWRFFTLISLACVATLGVPTIAGKATAKTTSQSLATNYVRYATGINIYGSPKDWHTLAARYGYYVSDKPVTGGVVSLEGGAYGTSGAYGFVAVVFYYHDEGDYWNIGTRYAYPVGNGTYYNHPYVKEQGFRVLKNDAKVHYISRSGMSARPNAYYSYPEYQGRELHDNQYVLSSERKDVTVYPETSYARAYVEQGRVVRVLAKAEVGETLWVFVKSADRSRNVYALTYYEGKAQLKRFYANSSDAYKMYYAKDYGDTVLDLGYADYSQLGGFGGKVTITIKKGENPMQLQPLQTITLQLANK